MIYKSLLFPASVCSLAVAAGPAATVSTGGPIEVNGTRIPNRGAPNWPLMPGDEIATSTRPAVIMYADGSRITIGKFTRVRLDKKSPAAVELVAGTADYRIAEGSRVQLFGLGQTLRPAGQSQGTVQVGGPDRVTLNAVSSHSSGLNFARPDTKHKHRSKKKKGEDDDDDQGDNQQ